ncbi:hypothetical protein, partial [Pseudomonas aeruginosa]|uniref:hypothetical protein n=1 Tax=Pseudomonas aeruginosa TaxID=287 RepID=UPI0031B72400
GIDARSGAGQILHHLMAAVADVMRGGMHDLLSQFSEFGLQAWDSCLQLLDLFQVFTSLLEQLFSAVGPRVFLGCSFHVTSIGRSKRQPCGQRRVGVTQ